jgi:hypothetical protein
MSILTWIWQPTKVMLTYSISTVKITFLKQFVCTSNVGYNKGYNYFQTVFKIRVFLEKLIICKLVNKFPVFHGSWRMITIFALAHHWSLSWAWIRSSRYTSSHLLVDLPSCLLPSGVPIKMHVSPVLCSLIWSSSSYLAKGVHYALPVWRRVRIPPQ